MRRLLRLPAFHTHGPWLWLGLCVLLALGTLSAVIDLAHLPNAETLRANATQQRVIIDPATGVVAGLSETTPDADDAPFDVAPEAEHPSAEAAVEAEDSAKPPVADTSPEAPPASETTAPPEAKSSDLPEGLPALRTAPPSTDPAPIARTRLSLISAPAPEVTEKLHGGDKLPRRGDKDVTPLSIYAQPFVRTPGQQRVAIVIIDAGLNAASLPLLTALPREITVAVSPYARHADEFIAQLRNNGQETWAMLPTMTERYPEADPGPMGLIANMPRDEQLRRLRAVMNTTLGSVGFVLPPDDSYSAKKDAFAATLGEINTRGMVLLSTHPSRSIEQLSADKTLQAIVRRADLVIDPMPNEAVIRSTLAGLGSAISGKSDTILLASARPQTLLILAEWLQQNPLPPPAVLAPLSAVYLPDPVPVEAPAEEKGGHGAPAHETAKPAEKAAPASGHH